MVDKDNERWYLDRFVSTCPDFLPGKLTPDEEPDFLVNTPSGMIGMELTRFYVQLGADERPRQEQENLRLKIVDTAGRVFASRESRRLHVNVQFSLDSNLHKRDIERVGEQIAASVEAVQIEEGNYEVIDSDLPPEVAHIMVVRSAALSSSYWHADDIAFTPEAGSDQLQGIIASKEQRLRKYRSKAHTNWLIIVVDGSALSSVADWPEETLSHVYNSAFDCVYLFLNAQNRSMRLSTHQ